MSVTQGTCKYFHQTPAEMIRKGLHSCLYPAPREDVHIPPPDINTGNTGEQIRDHKLTCSIINFHGTADAVFDDPSLELLRNFVQGRSTAKRDSILTEHDWIDEEGMRRGGKAVAKDGSLVGFLIARYGTEDPALDERDWELLDNWYQKGMPTGENVTR